MGIKLLNNLRSVFLLKDIRRLLNTSRSAFGDQVSEGLRIQSGWTFPYNLDTVFINQVVTNGGTVTHSGSMAILQSGTNPAGTTEINTKRALAYTPGIGAEAKFTAIFGTPAADCKQLVGIGNASDGWFFGYNGLRFGVVRINDSVENWSYQDEWSLDKKPNLNPQKGNVYQIDFQWLGYGAQYFSIENDIGDVAHVHRIDYSNQFTDVSVQNPSLPISAKIINSGNTTNITLKTSSAIAGSYGDIDSSAFEFPVGFDQLEKATSAGVETYLFSVRNPVTFESKVNRLFTIPTFLSIASDGTKAVVIRVYLDAAITGPTWVDLETGITPLQSDILASAFSGGLKVLTTTLGKVDRDTIDLSVFRGVLSPGATLTITALSPNASSITSGLTSKSRV